MEGPPDMRPAPLKDPDNAFKNDVPFDCLSFPSCGAQILYNGHFQAALRKLGVTLNLLESVSGNFCASYIPNSSVSLEGGTNRPNQLQS